MDLSCVISDIVQSAITKGADEVKITISQSDNLSVKIECKGFSFPKRANYMRSFGYEYILKEKFNISNDVLEFETQIPLGSIDYFAVSILSCNVNISEFKLLFKNHKGEYEFSKTEALKELGDVFVGEANVLSWIENEIKTNIDHIKI